MSKIIYERLISTQLLEGQDLHNRNDVDQTEPNQNDSFFVYYNQQVKWFYFGANKWLQISILHGEYPFE